MATINGTLTGSDGQTGTVTGEFLDGRRKEATIVFKFPGRIFDTAHPGLFSVRTDGTLHIDPDYFYGGAPESISYAVFDLTRSP